MDIRREIDQLRSGLRQLSIEPDTLMVERFSRYLALLDEFHGKIHLLSHADYDRVSIRHFLPSLAIGPLVDRTGPVCDLGAGPGFPSVPLAICDPQLRLTLFESQRKKAEFLKVLVTALRLDRIRILNQRAEEYRGPRFRCLLARAAGRLPKSLPVVQRLLAPGGRAVVFRTSEARAETATHAGSITAMGFHAEVKELVTPVEARPLFVLLLQKR